jgi:hypothetical protein
MILSNAPTIKTHRYLKTLRRFRIKSGAQPPMLRSNLQSSEEISGLNGNDDFQNAS